MSKFISIAVPTRGTYRFEGVKTLVKSVLDTADKIDDIEFVFKMDTDDPDTIRLIDRELPTHIDKRVIITDRGLGYADLNVHCTTLCKETRGEWVCLFSDDNTVITKGWDTILRNLSDEGHDSHVIWPNHLMGEHVGNVSPILHRNIINIQLDTHDLISSHNNVDIYWECVNKITPITLKLWHGKYEMIVEHKRKYPPTFVKEPIDSNNTYRERGFNVDDWTTITKVAQKIIEYKKSKETSNEG